MSQACQLSKKAKEAPGESPIKAGASAKLSRDLKEKVHEEIKKCCVRTTFPSRNQATREGSRLVADIQGAIAPALLARSARHLDRPLCSPAQLACSARLLSLPACPLRVAAQNAEKQYEVWANLAVKNDMAVHNPKFDPEKPCDEMIIWKPDGLDRLVSMNETDVRADQSKRGKSAGSRSVIVNAPGSRAGHSKGKSGMRKTISQQKNPHRGGYAGGSQKVGGKQGLKPGQLDRGDALSTKSASKTSYAGGRLGNGKSLSPHIMSDHPLSAKEFDAAPTGTARDADGNAIAATYNINTSGGMLEPDMLIWGGQIAAPSARATPQKRAHMVPGWPRATPRLGHTCSWG
eukprot:7385948-Prymnesium_polylepis.1